MSKIELDDIGVGPNLNVVDQHGARYHVYIDDATGFLRTEKVGDVVEELTYRIDGYWIERYTVGFKHTTLGARKLTRFEKFMLQVFNSVPRY